MATVDRSKEELTSISVSVVQTVGKKMTDLISSEGADKVGDWY
jgi:hypothetical protein